ncbi:hypothetical protein E24_00504 [Faustovirus]|nr:hypothetical protein E24_00504 [Faustovirus]AMN84398.1 hypothetical protein D5a_00501 [Faustovirus]AMN85387.1 hypothetical protein E23_00504 [Faustovirus]
MIDIAFNEIVKWNPSSWLCVSKKFTTRAVDVINTEYFEAFDWPFWRNIRILWAHYTGTTTAKKVYINDYVARNVDRLKTHYADVYTKLIKQHLDYYASLTKYIIDTLLVTGECLATSIPIVFNFITRQLEDIDSGLNNEKIINGMFNGKIIKVLVECYSSIVEEFIVGEEMISNMRVVRAIRCAMEGKQGVFTDNAFAIIDNLIFEDYIDNYRYGIRYALLQFSTDKDD